MALRAAFRLQASKVRPGRSIAFSSNPPGEGRYGPRFEYSGTGSPANQVDVVS